MIKGAGRRSLVNGKFNLNGSQPAQRSKAQASFGSTGMPDNLVSRAFAKSNARLSTSFFSNSPTELITLAREMYDEDPVSGGVVDIISAIPFGDFTLSGMPDKETHGPYLKSLERMRIKTLLPAIATTFMVDGAHLSTLIYNENQKVFDAIVPQDLLHARLTPAPFFGAAPIIDVSISQDMQRALGSKDPRMQRYLKHLPADMIKGGHLELVPENTLYVPRRTRADVALGTSLFRRIMPVYILDKALMRGTLEMAHRRQKGILHLLMGDENWDPTVAEMTETIDLFMAADVDPISAVVATRSGVQPQEVGGSEGAWKWTDSVDIITQVKLKGLGMPDGLLGGDMSLDSVGSTLTVFIQQTRQFRDYITRCVLYEKIFSYLSVVNEHRKSIYGFEETGEYSKEHRVYDWRPEYAADTEIEMGDYIIPTVSWHNTMRPEGDSQYLDMLNAMEEKGVPIPLRMRAAAGGINITDVLNGEEDDVEVRSKVAEYARRIASLAPQGDQGGDDNFNYEGANFNPIRRKGLLNREYDDKLDPVNVINGHRYLSTRTHKRTINGRVNKMIATCMSEKSKVMAKEAPQKVSLRGPKLLTGTYGA